MYEKKLVIKLNIPILIDTIILKSGLLLNSLSIPLG